ncbi:MAG: hypothetical protein L0Y72_02445 [Gemmataceae bacterium]|nr:hypothetical protein [Gemmataceae bacterium]MCI0737876.1 hypothetical protein [Gemmataceae bacterium]
MDFDLVKDLGAEAEPSGERLTLYIPDKDCNGGAISDLPEWVKEAQELLTDIGDGATCFPPVTGTWRKPEGEVLWEQTTMIYSFIDPDKFRVNMSRLRNFLHRFGTETNQGQVVFELGNLFWKINKFDPRGSQ